MRACVMYACMRLPNAARLTYLEPDFDLPLREAEHVGHFDAARTTQVLVVVELLLELEQLLSCVRCPGALGPALRRRLVARCKKQRT